MLRDVRAERLRREYDSTNGGSAVSDAIEEELS